MIQNDEFHQADTDDYLLDRADEHQIERDDWLELHGYGPFDDVTPPWEDGHMASREWP